MHFKACKYFLLMSVALHAFIVLSLFKQPTKSHINPIIDIELFKSTVKAPKAHISDAASGFSDLPHQRINTDGNSHLPLDKQLSADNYIERLRVYVEPEWRTQVSERIKQLKRLGRSWACTACVEGYLKANGSMAKVLLTQPCADSQLSALAVKALHKQLPPPPSILLEKGHLILAWCFATR